MRLVNNDYYQKRLQIGVFFILFYLVYGFLCLLFPLILESYFSMSFNGLKALEVPEAGSRILVFSPHPDDEIIGCYGFIKSALENNCMVKVVVVTNGDGIGKSDIAQKLISYPTEYFLKTAYKKQLETRQALSMIGVPKEDIIFLGYPDGHILDLWDNNWKGKAFMNPTTKSICSPYNNSYMPEAEYTGTSLVKNIELIINEYKPTHILFPHSDDMHNDHFAVNNFVKFTIAKLQYNANELTYLVHRGLWPFSLGMYRSLKLVPPKDLKGKRDDWYSIDLTADMISEKEKCVNIYKSETGNYIMKSYLTSFIRENELYGTSDDRTALLPDKYSYEQSSIATIETPVLETLQTSLNGSMDIKKFIITVNHDSLEFSIETRNNPKPAYKYTINLVLLKPDKQFMKFSVNVFEGKIMVDNLDYNAILLKDMKTEYAFDGHLVNIKLKTNFLYAIDAFLTNAVIYKDEILIDKTGLRYVDIKK